jgi:hypothetical protein
MIHQRIRFEGRVTMGTNILSSDFLFLRPSLARGFARTLDIAGSLNSYNWSGSGEQADALAMYVDWALVGAELSAAMTAFAKKPVDRAGNEQLSLLESSR